jgi:hypothetical protein
MTRSSCSAEQKTQSHELGLCTVALAIEKEGDRARDPGGSVRVGVAFGYVFVDPHLNLREQPRDSVLAELAFFENCPAASRRAMRCGEYGMPYLRRTLRDEHTGLPSTRSARPACYLVTRLKIVTRLKMRWRLEGPTLIPPAFRECRSGGSRVARGSASAR